MLYGVSLPPAAADLDGIRAAARAADEGGLDLIGIQDHPYVAGFVDSFALIADLLAATRRVRLFPDVANLPLRPPGVLAKTAASLDLMSGGRFELGLGAGAYWPAIAAMTGLRRNPAEALAALEEAIEIVRAMWRPGRTVRATGRYYTVNGVHAGPAPAHPVSVWLGSVGPRSLRLAGRLADGWAAPIPRYLPYESRAEANAHIDRGAQEAGRDPAEVLRIAQLVGTVADEAGHSEAREGADPVRGTPRQWADLIARVATEQGFGAFVFWPEEPTRVQVERFAYEVAPAARALLPG